MNSEIKIVNNGKELEIYTPYSAEFVSQIKSRVGGARWNSEKRCWTTSIEALDTVREILNTVYGFSDIDSVGKSYTVRIEVLRDFESERAPVSLFNREVARAFGRDSGAKIAENVLFVNGKPTSGGSKQYWNTTIPEGSVFDILHIPDKVLENGKKQIADMRYEYFKIVSITPETEPDDRSKLLEEKERLFARVAEINKELGIE